MLKINKLNNLKNSIGDTILLEEKKYVIKIQNKDKKILVKIDYKLQPKEAIKILEERKFIKNTRSEK